MHTAFFVYIATNKRKAVLYAGITNTLTRRAYEHKNKLLPGFTSKYNVQKIVYYETFTNPSEAIAAEKKIKGWTRQKKINLINGKNPSWRDLCDAQDPSPATAGSG